MILRALSYVSHRTWRPRYLFNRCLQVLEYMRGATVCRSRPNFITLELTNHCNLRCTLCPYDKMTRPRGNMDMSLFTSIVDQVADSIEVIDFDLFGEFEYNPKWRDMISYCASRNIYTVLNTNATLLNDKTADGLIDSGLDFLILSFDGASKESYERIRAGATFEKTLHNVDRFLQKNRSIFTTVQMVHTTETAEEIAAYRRFWRDRGASRVRIKDYIRMDPTRGHLDPRPPPRRALPCMYLWKNLVISQDGSVVPCCVDYDHGNVLGNARWQSIDEIWNGVPMQQLREKHAAGRYRDVALCAPCRPVAFPPLIVLGSALVDDSMRRRLY
jgi:radical SAM protein with 4Fe4S-binding SPASM domain